MNYNDEVHRFAAAGALFAQADRGKLSELVDLMVERKVGWSPTFSIYDASRDVVRAQNLPWFKEYLHPSLEAFFRPSRDNHGSYFLGWTSVQESQWKEQFRIWMSVVREFGKKGGLVTTGDDAGYIYSMYGFGIARELELQQEAGFDPLEVIEHATWNGARMVGLDDRIGKVREGFTADLLVVNGNPLDDLKLLNPYGTDVMLVNGRQVSNYTAPAAGDRVQVVHGGGIEWTIKDGIPYHVPTLMREVREIVAQSARDRPARRRPDGRQDSAQAAPGLDLSIVIAAPPTLVMRAFFDSDALGAWWSVKRSVTTPRVLGPYAVEWRPTEYRDEILGRLGGVFRGTIMQFEAGRGFFVADALLAAARRRSDRPDGARGDAARRADGRHRGARRAERLRGKRAMAALLRGRHRRVAARAQGDEELLEK